MLGDGEIQEGPDLGSGHVRGRQSLDNLVAIVDYNRIQLDGFVNDIMPLEPLPEKWRAFNWQALDIDGHDIPALQAAFSEARRTKANRR